MQLARLLGANSAGERAVDAARERPAEYVSANTKALARLGVSAVAPPRDLAWIVLIEELVKRRRAAAIDWRASPAEIARDLRGIQRDVGDLANRCLDGALQDRSASAFLARVAQELEATERVLARIDPRPGDTAVVVVLDRGDLPAAAALARRTGVGRVVAVTKQPLASPPRLRGHPRMGSWRAILLELGVTNTNGLLIGLAQGEIEPAAITPVAAKAPGSERGLVRAVLALLAGRPLAAGGAGARITPLKAIGYLMFARGREQDLFRMLIGTLRDGADRNISIKERRAAVQALRFGTASARGRAAFVRLDETERAFLRGLVREQLDSRDVSALEAALDAARVVGDLELRLRIRSLTKHPSGLVAKAAREAMRALKSS